MSGGSAPLPPGFQPPQQPVGQATGSPGSWPTLQGIELILNAIYAQLKTGITLGTSLPTFLFANLPVANTVPGMLVFASNALKPGEISGNGSGITVYSDGVGWYTTAGVLAAD